MKGEPSQRRELYLEILRVSLPKNHRQNPPTEPEIALVCFEPENLKHSRDFQGMRAGRAQIAVGSPAPPTLNRSYHKHTV